jgi:hypothetical protein
MSAKDVTAILKKLPYYRPTLGKDYWIIDDVLPNAAAVHQRFLARTDWSLGLPWRPETWPGMRAANALLPEEMAIVENIVKRETNNKRLWQADGVVDGALSHNFIQVVGEKDSGPRPHTDSRKLCRYAAVLYLTPNAPLYGGTSFYRLRLPDGSLGGNTCPAPHANLREALGIPGLPLQAWTEDVPVENKFNRMLLYRANLVHSARAYFGHEMVDKRKTALFFWMAE